MQAHVSLLLGSINSFTSLLKVMMSGSRYPQRTPGHPKTGHFNWESCSVRLYNSDSRGVLTINVVGFTLSFTIRSLDMFNKYEKLKREEEEKVNFRHYAYKKISLFLSKIFFRQGEAECSLLVHRNNSALLSCPGWQEDPQRFVPYSFLLTSCFYNPFMPTHFSIFFGSWPRGKPFVYKPLINCHLQEAITSLKICIMFLLVI